MNYFAKNLKFLLGKFDVTQTQLSFHLDKGQNTISNWINKVSAPDIDSIVLIYQFFGITPDGLILMDLEDGNLITDHHVEEFRRNGRLKSKVTGNLKPVSTSYLAVDDRGLSVVNEPDPVANWAIMGQFKQVQEKLDQLRILGEEILKKQDK